MKRSEIVILTFAGLILTFAGLILTFGFSFISCNQSSSSKINSISENFKRGDHVIEDAVKDVDGNRYDAVQLGDQVWMAENLKTKSVAKHNVSEEGYSDVPRYVTGTEKPRLYEEGTEHDIYYSVSAARQNICPEGWRVPTVSDWRTLSDYLTSKPEYIYGNSETYIAKSLASNRGWDTYAEPTEEVRTHVGCNPVNTNNATKFNAKPTGMQILWYENKIYSHPDYGEVAYFWTSNVDKESVQSGDKRYISNAKIEIHYDSPLLEIDDWAGAGSSPIGEDFLPIRCIKIE